MAYLGRADTDVGYTERGIANYPQCNIRDHVKATRMEIDRLRGIFRSSK
jgi:hypothetical protein